MCNRIFPLAPVLYLCLLLATLVAAADTGAYVPSESFLVNCGSSSDAADAHGRKWSADDASKFGVSTKNSTTAASASQDLSLPSAVPYMTARVFTSESTYKFSVNKTARHWILL